MKYFILILSFLSILSAKSPTNLDLSKRMLDVMNKNGYMDILIKRAVTQEIASNPLLSSNPKAVKNFANRYLSFKSLKPQLIGVYARELSKDELIAFTKFCDTKEGQKILLKMPRLINISSYIAQKKIMKEYPRLLNSLLSTNK